MSLFCLVHGSAQGPSGWDLLVPELNKRVTKPYPSICRQRNQKRVLHAMHR